MGDVVRLRSTQRPEPVREPEPLPPLWREAVGAEIRRARHDAERTLGDVAERAGISTAYLSEVERGRKEPSSEVLDAIAGALELRLVDLTYRVTRQLAGARDLTSRTTGPGRPTGPVALAV
ncbi:hypothetical protein GCM10011519_03550 [Marmoricola endophyticus]|uniref:HTH cro/C1-type domain-containing protein n=1 Tax=Marmoricola endophyticus TaxID=2040280 RepID=A0A917B9U8_9ACTN|nr:helix-turn-helix transcriptional regulator [Marmoricola endophyticus]GGF33393.1 hypothetical protein GCM10011519_03550 [Marmoricola endophyticus]